MVQNTTIEAAQDSETENYRVFESADGDTVVGAYVAEAVASALGEFISLTFHADADSDDRVELLKNKDTKNYGVYETDGGAISGIYVSHDVLESEENDEGETVAPDAIGLSMDASDEEAFENAESVDEEEVDALTSGDSDDDDDTSQDEEVAALTGDDPVESVDEAEDSDTSGGEEVEVSDEDIGLVDE